MNLKNMLYTGILLAGSAVTTLFSGGCASSPFKHINLEVLDRLNPKNAVMEQQEEKQNKGLENSVRFEMNYQKGRRQKVPHAETDVPMRKNEEREWVFERPYNSLINTTVEERDAVKDVLNSITTSTYNEFTNNLSQLSEREITLALSALAKFMVTSNTNKDINCEDIHNFISETARKSGLQNAVTFSCELKEGKHIASALWSNYKIKLIDYGNIYAGNSNLELMLREYQRIQKTVAFGHRIYDEHYLLTITTSDGDTFYNAINHSKDTKQLKETLTNSGSKKTPFEIKVGNTENSFRFIDKNNISWKVGHIRGADEPVYWDSPFFKISSENSLKNFKYNLSLLVFPIKNREILGVSGNLAYNKKINLTSSDNLTIGNNLRSLIDLPALESKTSLLNEGDWLALETGVSYTHTFNNKTKKDIYFIIRAEPVYEKVTSNKIKPIISELRTGGILTSGKISINPEYLRKRESETFSLEADYKHKTFTIGAKVSNSNSLHKFIWPDKKSLEVSGAYTFTDDLSIGGSINYSQKKWSSDEKYDSKVNVWLKVNF